MNATLFISTVLIWGTTWIAIAFQVGPVPVVVSVFYCFATAGLLFLLVLAMVGKLTVPERRHRAWVVAQALCLFSLNFICFYTAAADIPSGLISVVFSLATVFNAFNARLFFGERITSRALLASAIGVTGLVLLLGAELSLDDPWGTLRGIGFAALGTMLFSLGNMVSRRNTAAGLPTVNANAWGMACGAIILMGIIGISGAPVVAPPDAVYMAAMLYLAVVGSIIGFTTYLLLVARIGASQAAYATVLFPIVALTISTFAEGYVWTWVKGLGGLAGACRQCRDVHAGRNLLKPLAEGS
ncbi:EamA family transporter [Roseovarius sp.]|uniref:DMT family transporter n=1 Tax=Roseovarius sp. TaxID=1486281 RepID=UPI00257D0930|nr:EamA family transporter [Roseovarius sp.]|tara:strand:- start:466 stop:1362 length:897 start_codon:yes stop_codon:yes gene_type:complete